MFVLPPAPCGPYFHVNGVSVPRTMPSGSCSTRTLDQSASISSAMIIGSEVFTPWPISGERAPMNVVPSFSMRTSKPIAGAESAEEGEPAARESRGTKCSESSRPPAALAPSCMNVRRSRVAAESGLFMQRMLASIGHDATRGRLGSSQGCSVRGVACFTAPQFVWGLVCSQAAKVFERTVQNVHEPFPWPGDQRCYPRRVGGSFRISIFSAS